MSHSVDAHVGKRIRHRRWQIGFTQQQLAEKTGVKFQQIQKYETGMNRVSASRLWDIGVAMGVPASYFFEGLTGEASAATDIMMDKQAVELVQTFYAMPASQRERMFDLMKSLATAAA